MLSVSHGGLLLLFLRFLPQNLYHVFATTILQLQGYNLTKLFSSIHGPVPLDIGRLATGYGMGVFSYLVGYSSTLQKTT